MIKGILTAGVVGLGGYFGFKAYKHQTARSSAELVIKQMMLSDKPGQNPDNKTVKNLANDYVGRNLVQLQVDAGLLVSQGYPKTAVLFQTRINDLGR